MFRCLTCILHIHTIKINARIWYIVSTQGNKPMASTKFLSRAQFRLLLWKIFHGNETSFVRPNFYITMDFFPVISGQWSRRSWCVWQRGGDKTVKISTSFRNCPSYGRRLVSVSTLSIWTPWFLTIVITRGTNSFPFVCLPSEKGSTIKGKNLLLWEQILSF